MKRNPLWPYHLFQPCAAAFDDLQIAFIRSDRQGYRDAFDRVLGGLVDIEIHANRRALSMNGANPRGSRDRGSPQRKGTRT